MPGKLETAHVSRFDHDEHRRRVSTRHRPALWSLFLTSFLGNCVLFPLGPRDRTTPLPSGPAPASASVLVLVYPLPRMLPAGSLGQAEGWVGAPWVDVLAENGEALARLPPGTWTTLTRAPGRHRLLVVSTSGPGACIEGTDASIGTLDADLVAGRYAHVAVFARPVSLQTALSTMCCAPSDMYVDLVRVPLLGELRADALDVMNRGRAVDPLPRGIISPYAEAVRRLATARETSRCFDAGSSRVRPGDQTSLPLNQEEPMSDELTYR